LGNRCIGNLVVEDVGRIRDENAFGRGMRDIDAVIADAEISDDLKIGKCVDPGGVEAADDRGGTNTLSSLPRDIRAVAPLGDDDLEAIGEPLHDTRMDLSRDENGRSGNGHGRSLLWVSGWHVIAPPAKVSPECAGAVPLFFDGHAPCFTQPDGR
jgi:hypothetical protein